MSLQKTDIAIIGGGAAGLATAIFAARRVPERSIAILDGAAKLGAKILASGGGRCNVTNVAVRPADYNGGSAHAIKRVLDAFTIERTVGFFRELGVALHEEADGKLFPDNNSAQTVLSGLLGEINRLGVCILLEHRVEHVEREAGGFTVHTGQGPLLAGTLVLATGGQSLPATGSNGAGYEIARQLGHSLVPTTPALVPLILEGDFYSQLSGVSQDVELTVKIDKAKPVRLAGAMLWTHFGVSGPAVLNASRFWHRARLEDRPVRITANLLPGETFASAEARLMTLVAQHPRTALRNALANLLPARVAALILERTGIGGQIPLAHLNRDDRRRLLHALLEWPLEVRDSRGYEYAEVTAGGVPLNEINPASMESRKCPGLFLAGEILDVDGRIGGFNFQWAWSSAYVAAASLTI